MRCPAPEQLAAAATFGDDAVLAHAVACERCLHALDDQRAMRALVHRTPAVVLTRDRREAMAAELMAQADQLPAAAQHPDPLGALTPEQREATAAELIAQADPLGALTRERREEIAAEVLAKAEQLPVLTRERREAMAAELMAHADQLDAPSILSARRAARRRTVALVVAGLAAAAAIVIVVATRAGSDANTTGSRLAAGSAQPTGLTEQARSPVVTAIEADAPAIDRVAPEPVPEPPAPLPEPRTSEPRAPAKLAGSGDYTRDAPAPGVKRDVVRLRGGELTVDSTGSRPVEIVSGETAIAVKKARVKVIAIKGVVSSVAVFAGSAEVTVDGHRVIVEAGTVWERDDARDDALAAFRTGWTALRAGNNADAIAAFDRATDPIVAEDATYWSAIASERAGDTNGAVRRYRELLAKFPKTTRAAEANAAITRLAP